MSLTLSRPYADGAVLTEAQLDAVFDQIEAKFNTTLIAGSEIQALAIEAANIAGSAVTTAKIADGAVTSVKRTVTTSTKTTTYTATSSDEVILADTSGGAWTLTLPAAASSTGKRLKIIKTTSDFNALTVDGNSSETINGDTTTTLNTQYEALDIVCNGTAWFIEARYIPSVRTSYTPTITGLGTPTVDYCYWKRMGDHVFISAHITPGTPTAVALTVSLPSGLTGVQTVSGLVLGNAGTGYDGTSSGIFPFVTSGSPSVIQFGHNSSRVLSVALNGNALTTGASTGFTFTAMVQISGWKG